MIADIFHPIFTLTITILACFIRKKAKLFRDLHTHVYHIFTKASPWPQGDSHPAQLQLFLALHVPMPYFYYIIC